MTDLVAQWAKQTVFIEHAASSWDGNGNPVLGAASSNAAIVQFKTRAVIGRNGVLAASACQVMLSGSASVTIDDRITLPDGTSSPILSVEKIYDFDGNPAYVQVYT